MANNTLQTANASIATDDVTMKRPGLMPLLFESRRMSTMSKKMDEELEARAA